MAEQLRVGLAVVYAWRPHVEHAHFVAHLLRKAGHEVFHLACDGDLPTCYTRELRGRPPWLECLACRAGGVRSYPETSVDSIGRCARDDDAVAPAEWGASSASTLRRFETDAEYASAEFAALVDHLQPAVQKSYRAARAWIRKHRLDAVCVFNGRMDATRAILEAARSLGVRALSMERTWFSDGLQLYPDENCLGLRSVDSLIGAWRDVPLTREQALRAASYAARRFLRQNVSEWRAYNVDARVGTWPAAGRRRVLLLPSSRNEVWGHPDWASGWTHPVEAYDALVAHLGLQPDELVLRCHPNWAERIGRQGGEASERAYAGWAAARGVHCIAAADRASTLDLIAQCDAIVVAGGSAALEAGTLGRQVIAVGPSIYQQAGLRDAALSPADLPALSLLADLPEAERAARSAQIRRMTLRFTYSMVRRVPQYTREVRADSPTQYRYDLDAAPARLVELLRSGRLRADDETRAADTTEEDAVLERLARRDWQGLLDELPADPPATGRLQRRWAFRVLDAVRPLMPVGDR